MRLSARLVLALCASLLALSPALAGEPPPVPESVRVTVEITRSDKADKPTTSSYELVGVLGEKLELTSSFRIPFPVATSKDAGDAMVSFSYQNVGVSLVFDLARATNDRYRVHGRAETSVLRNPSGDANPVAQPIVGSFSYDLQVVVRAGKLVRVVSATEPPAGPISISVRVDALD